MRTIRVRRPGSEDGQALVMVLVFLVLFSVVIGLLLTQSQSTFVLNETTQGQSKALYAADGGLQWGIKQMGSTNVCGSSTVPTTGVNSPINLPGVTNVTVTCTQATGPGTNLFGGYAVVSGVGYPSTSTSEGSTTCQSFSSDPIGGGKSTFSQQNGGRLCLTYPSSSGSVPPQWTSDVAGNPSAPTKSLNAVSPVDSSDVFAVGNATGGQEYIWYFDEDDNFTQVSTALNTGGVVNSNLDGVWAADVSHVWAVGQATTLSRETILFCSSSCTTSSSSWALQSAPTLNVPLNDVYGTSASSVFAVGNAVGTAATILSYNAGTQSWAALGTAPSVKENLLGVYATDASDVWAVGQSGTILYWNGSTWAPQATPGGTGDLLAVSGTDSSHLWAVGQGGTVLTCTANCTSASATWVKLAVPGGTGDLTGVVAGDTTDVWAAGKSGVVIYCTASCNTSGASWVTQTVPTGTPDLYDVGFTPPNPTGSGWSGDVWAVGNNGTVLSYAGTNPSSTCSSGDQTGCLADISGGPVFNAQAANFATGVNVAANFTQMSSSPSCSQPSNLLISTGYNYNCTTTVPPSLQSLNEPLPNLVPAAAASPISVPVSGVSGCTSYRVFFPGTYSSGPSLVKGGTNFFESGVYYFKNGFGGFDNGNNPPDTLYVIGGQPTTGDPVAIASGSPCWSAIQASTYYTANAPETGVEWILGGGTWMDVHTVNLELFTHDSGPASEGAQGISIREVPPACSGTQLTTPGPGPSCVTAAQQTSGWSPSTPNQLFQVDANDHLPHVFIHGGLYMPTNNLEEFTNTQAVTLGPIDANSIELTYASSSSPPLSIEAGTGNPEVLLTATAYSAGQPFQVEGLWGYAQGATKPSLLNWWVVTRS
ncbi:MAG TPA: hypothetical protein VMV14_08990 [Acidimicrobiales bacterium]|nr:hypothetical protein [Acidimicrobiales bacterium]